MGRFLVEADGRREDENCSPLIPLLDCIIAEAADDCWSFSNVLLLPSVLLHIVHLFCVCICSNVQKKSRRRFNLSTKNENEEIMNESSQQLQHFLMCLLSRMFGWLPSKSSPFHFHHHSSL
jgi:hypothetical protein